MKIYIKKTGFIKSLGPGLLWAGAAIGVSHLVQSTKAGAVYGFSLVAIVILANIFKYPFFEFGTRYAASTGKNLLQGYREQGRGIFGLYLVLTFGTMFTIQAAVTIVTAGLLSWLTGNIISPVLFAVIILSFSIVLLFFGNYSLLDRFMKVIIIVLTITTIVALIAAIGKQGLKLKPGMAVPVLWDLQGIAFMIALMGWMPSAIDISVWSSIWTLEKRKETGYKQKLNEALFDFNLGYIGTSVISLAFLTLGALVVFGSGEVLSKNGSIFAGQFISMYTKSIGSWSKYIIAIAAITTMFSTTITCLDAFARVLKESTKLIFPELENRKGEKLYWGWMLFVATGAIILLSLLKGGMGFMVTLATTLSFLTAPVLAVINFKVVTGKGMPAEGMPPKWLRWLSWAGIMFLTGFSSIFLYFRFFAN
ncbi:MAG: divalent metal cation transporter [Acidobacteriota bacterium]